jgi:hypothetical protein
MSDYWTIMDKNSASYTTIQPPFTLKFEEMSKAELKDYYRWFLLNIPERIQELTAAVRQTPGFESWEPDYTRSSLEKLGDWFRRQVESRPATPEETREEMEQMGMLWSGPIGTRRLTDKTKSLATDVGMYVSQVFVRNHPSLKWEQPLGSKNYVDYGQPVVGGFGEKRKGQFNPVGIMLAHAATHEFGGRGPKDLVTLYETWANTIPPNQETQR